MKFLLLLSFFSTVSSYSADLDAIQKNTKIITNLDIVTLSRTDSSLEYFINFFDKNGNNIIYPCQIIEKTATCRLKIKKYDHFKIYAMNKHAHFSWDSSGN